MQKNEAFGSLRRPFIAGLALGLLVFLLPLFTLSGGREPAPLLPPGQESPALSTAPVVETWDSGHTLRVLLEDGTVSELTMADYLWRVVAAEMPASFEPAALEAQAVCARTYSLWKLAGGTHQEDGADLCADSGCCQAYIDPSEAEERWGEQAAAHTVRIAAAVSATDGQYLSYGGKPIQAVFFSSSTAVTEDAAAVWGSALPYLVSVDSPEGEEVPNYRSTVTLTAEEVESLAAEAGLDADLTGEPAQWLTDMSYTASGRVAELKLGGVALSGGAARTLFGLRSACFTVTEAEGVFTFSVTGYGHGVGMSQYGANAMAKEGHGWQDIVTHYYTGVTVESKHPHE